MKPGAAAALFTSFMDGVLRALLRFRIEMLMAKHPELTELEAEVHALRELADCFTGAAGAMLERVRRREVQ